MYAGADLGFPKGDAMLHSWTSIVGAIKMWKLVETTSSAV